MSFVLLTDGSSKLLLANGTDRLLRSGTSYAEEVLDDNPLGFWKLDEGSGTPADSSGNGFNGSWVGTPAYASRDFGLTGLSDVADFNGAYVTITDATGLGDQVTNATIEAWVIFDSTSGARLIFTQDNTSSSSRPNFYFWWKGSTGKIVVGWRTGSTYYDHEFSWSPSTATTYHLVATVDGTNVRFYVDGSLVGTVAQSSAPSAGVGVQYVIGADYGGTSKFSGAIGYVAFYDTALSGTRVAAHYSAATASVVAKSDTDSFTFSESEALTTLTAKADTDSATFTETGESISALVAKADTDTFTATDAASLAFRTSLVATDLFRATELSFLNYSPTPPLNVKFSGHRVYAQLADADNLPAVPSPSRTFRMPTTTEDLDLYLLDENLTIIDPAGLTVTFDVGTPGVRVEGVDDDITVEPSGDGDPLVWITIPGGLLPGTYSCRATVNTGTEESPVYRSYPTEAITLIVED